MKRVPRELCLLMIFSGKGESTVIPATEGRFVVYNGFDCHVYANRTLQDAVAIGPLASSDFVCASFSDEETVNVTLKFGNSCGSFVNGERMDARVTVTKGEV